MLRIDSRRPAPALCWILDCEPSAQWQSLDEVRGHLDELVRHAGAVTLRGPVDKLDLFQPWHARADAIEAQSVAATGTESTKVIRDALQAMGAFK